MLTNFAGALRRCACTTGSDRAELKGWLFLSAPGARKGKLMTLDKRGRLKEGKLAAMIEAEVIKHNIDIVSIDPFVKSHSVEENANTMIDEVAQVLVGLGYTHDMRCDSPHHIAKGPADPGNANRGRGASALKDAARLVYTLTPMSADEAAKFKLPRSRMAVTRAHGQRQGQYHSAIAHGAMVQAGRRQAWQPN